MKQIGESLPELNETRKLEKTRLESLDTQKAISDFVTQCYDIFPKYGDDSLSVKIKAFIAALDDCSHEDISYSFQYWLKEGGKFPLPSDIRSSALARAKHRRSVNVNPAKALTKKTPKNSVPWYGLTWMEIQDQGYTKQVEEHLIKLADKRGIKVAEGYLNFLQNGPINK